MKFQSRWRNTTYVLRRSYVKYHEGLGKEIVPGLLAKFRGPQRLFDSESAQVRNGWSDEERIHVENKLLAHKDFGGGLYLAPGELIPDDRIQFITNKSALARAETRCQFLYTEVDQIKQCPKTAAVGNQFCDDHRQDNPQIQKGMLTSDGGSTGNEPVMVPAVPAPDSD